MSEIEEIKNRIFSKKGSRDYDPIDIYHYLMIHYGYIPYDDFFKMNADLVNELLVRLNEMNEKVEGGIPKGRLGRKMR